MQITRRTAAGLAAAMALPAAKVPGNSLGGPHRISLPPSGLQFATMNSNRVDHKARISKQIGVNYAICGANLGRLARGEYEAALARMKADFASIGMQVAGVESHPVPAEKIKLALKDATKKSVNSNIAAIGSAGVMLGIKVLVTTMAGLGWYRTQVDRMAEAARY
ncbi:MAG: hypothetical protein U0R19_21855 [Bryobacteraceae bacterium]